MFGGFQPANNDDMRRQLYDGLMEFGIYAIVLRALPYVFHFGKFIAGKVSGKYIGA